MASPGHRDNILGDYRYAGIGVERRDGTLWVTQRFMRLGSGCSLPAASRPTFHWLDVEATGSGEGSVTSSPAGVACGSDCRAPFIQGAEVTLTAVAAAGSEFRGWSGGGCTGTGACSVTMDQARDVTALFVARHVLTVSTTGSGEGSVTSSPAGVDCGADCSETFDEGTVVTLSATPEEGSVFGGWSGDACSSEGTPQCVLTLLDDRSVEAEFVVQHHLGVELLGAGAGVVYTDPEGIECPGDCSAPFDEGTEVTLYAVAETGSAFMGWDGDVCIGTDDCAVSMFEAHLVTAEFARVHDLDVSKGGTGNGTVTSTPRGIRCGFDCYETFPDGAEVALRAQPNRWSRFVRWTGACAGAGATCFVTVDRALSTTAIFNRRRR